MRKTTWLATIGLAAAALALLLLLPVGQAISSEIVQVVITNWPTTQAVKGEMVVTAPVPMATEVSILEIVVPPVPRGETTRLIHAGRVVTDGFPSIVLSLHGEVRGQVQKPGSVGVILLPEEKSIQDAFNDQGVIHFALETEAPGINSKTPYFASRQPRYTVAFTSYTVLLYNTTDKTVTANVYAYLTQ
jgi:hypothetical protein